MLTKAKRVAALEKSIKLQERIKANLAASSLDTSREQALCDQLIAQMRAMIQLGAR